MRIDIEEIEDNSIIFDIRGGEISVKMKYQGEFLSESEALELFPEKIRMTKEAIRKSLPDKFLDGSMKQLVRMTLKPKYWKS